MSYAANFDTARIYLDTGLKERAREYLLKVVEAVPEGERGADNLVYLKSLVLLARMAVEQGDQAASVAYVEQGLVVKPDHADLLFLKALLLWDVRHYDDMFLTLMAYLAAIVDDGAASHQYEYGGEQVVAEAVYKLLPEAYLNSAARGQLAAAIAATAARSEHALIQTVHKVIQKADRHG